MIKGTSANFWYIPCNAFMLHHLTTVISCSGLMWCAHCFLLRHFFKEAILNLVPHQLDMEVQILSYSRFNSHSLLRNWMKTRLRPRVMLQIPWKWDLNHAVSIFSHTWQRLPPHSGKVMHANIQRRYIQGPVLIYKTCLVSPKASYLYPQNEVLDAICSTCLRFCHTKACLHLSERVNRRKPWNWSDMHV